MTSGADLLRIEKLQVSFGMLGGTLTAVRDASLRVLPGKVTALVGESGSGKSVISQAVMGILPQTASAGGRILFSDPERGTGPVDILAMPRDGRAIRSLRGSRIGKIFQEPMTSLSPLHTIGDQVSEALRIHEPVSRAELRERTEEMLGLVGFANPARTFSMYPFELSGGMRQRVNLARAFAVNPDILLMDEPFAALDALTRETMQQELVRIVAETGKTVLFITHQIDEAILLADRIAVLSARPGRVARIIDVNLPKPRTLALKRTPEFNAMVEDVWALIAGAEHGETEEGKPAQAHA